MSTETWTLYRVRRDDNAWLVRRWSGAWVWAESHPVGPFETTSRRVADALAAEHGGWVEEVVTTTRRVGLRWIDKGRYWELSDGDRRVAVVTLAFLPTYTWWALDSHDKRADTLDAAKAAAERAVREGWS